MQGVGPANELVGHKELQLRAPCDPTGKTLVRFVKARMATGEYTDLVVPPSLQRILNGNSASARHMRAAVEDVICTRHGDGVAGVLLKRDADELLSEHRSLSTLFETDSAPERRWREREDLFGSIARYVPGARLGSHGLEEIEERLEE